MKGFSTHFRDPKKKFHYWMQFNVTARMLNYDDLVIKALS